VTKKNGWWNCVQIDTNKLKIKNWKKGQQTADWEKSIKEAKVSRELQCHWRRRRRRTEEEKQAEEKCLHQDISMQQSGCS